MIEYRFEFKYVTDAAIAKKAESLVRSYGMVPDPAGFDGEYPVASLYFDNFHKRDYYDKSGGFLRRKKIRGRVYGKDFNVNPEAVWLEVKERHDAATKKTRFKISSDEWRELLVAGPDRFWMTHKEKGNGDLSYILREMSVFNRNPAVFVRYIRRPYLGFYNGSKVRITFDRELEARGVFSGDRFSTLYPGEVPWYISRWVQFEPHRVVLEIKFSSVMPPWFGELTRFLELERVSISKYARAIEASRVYQVMPR